MKIIKKMINYIKDSNFKIIYINNSVNIINFDSILEVREDMVTLKKEDKLIFIKGNDLRIDKSMDREILITGVILKIEL